MTATTTTTIPFLDTHPGGEERVRNIKELIVTNHPILPKTTPHSRDPKEELASTAATEKALPPDITGANDVTLVQETAISKAQIYTAGLVAPDSERGTISPSLVFLVESNWDMEEAYSQAKYKQSIDVSPHGV